MKGKKEVIIGLTVIVTIALLIFGIDYLKGINFFSSNRTFYSYYGNVQTLVPGSAIRLNGIQVGVVSDLYIDPNNQFRNIAVLNIANEKLKIPKETKAKLGSDILGTSFIELILDSNFNELLKEGDTIAPDYKYGAMEIVSQRIDPIETRVTSILARVDVLLGSVENVVGEDGQELKGIMLSLKKSLNTLNGTINTTDELIKANTQSITNTLRNVESITLNLRKSNDKITNLITNFSDLSDTLKNTDITGTVKEAKQALAGVTKVMDEINNGDGSMHQLIYNDSLINNVNGMIAEAQRLVENIKAHPNRYLQFAVFGSKDKGIKLDAHEEQKLKQMLND